MKRILLALFMMCSFSKADNMSLIEDQFQFSSIRFDLPNDYIQIYSDGPYQTVSPDYGLYLSTNIYTNTFDNPIEIITDVNTNYGVGIWSYPFDTAYSNAIQSGIFQSQELELIDNIITSEADDNFWAGEDYFDQVTTNPLMVIDGLIVKSFTYDDLGDDSFRYTGKYFIVIDKSSIYSFSSDYETSPNSYEDHPQLDVETIMSMDERVYSIDPIRIYEGLTNVYNFGVSTNGLITRTMLLETINYLESNITSLSNQISGLIAATNILNNEILILESITNYYVGANNALNDEILMLESITNNMGNADQQLAIINNIVNVYQSQIDILEVELAEIYEYTNRMTITEAQTAMRDLRVGSQTFGVSNGNAKIRMYLEESSDLTSTWSNTQHVLELDIPADADTKFYRFRMD